LGGVSQLENSEILTLSTLDEDDFLHDDRRKIIRDTSLEKSILKSFSKSNIGAQGNGKFFLMPDGIRIYRAPRHAAHFFVGIAVACSAHRVQKFKINKDGAWLEKLVKNPAKNFPGKLKKDKKELLNFDFKEQNNCSNLKELRKLSAGTNFEVSGEILIARDKAHFLWIEKIKQGKIPKYLNKFIAIIYAGPSETPQQEIIGSFGPTTAGRMDDMTNILWENGLLPLTIAKGSRSKNLTNSAKKNQGMFASLQGGPASYWQAFITKQEIIDFPELGMESVKVISVKKLPLQMVIDASGNNFYDKLNKSLPKFEIQK
jgi:fumarate hydratase class I